MAAPCCTGMINGELFRKVMANSPGGILADTAQGHPPVFMSAGLQDNIFPTQQAGNAVSRKNIISDMLLGVSGLVYLPYKVPVNTGSITADICQAFGACLLPVLGVAATGLQRCMTAQDACYLEQEGYTVTYVQFNGTHEVPPAIAADTIKWYQGSFQQTFPLSVCTG